MVQSLPLGNGWLISQMPNLRKGESGEAEGKGGRERSRHQEAHNLCERNCSNNDNNNNNSRRKLAIFSQWHHSIRDNRMSSLFRSCLNSINTPVANKHGWIIADSWFFGISNPSWNNCRGCWRCSVGICCGGSLWPLYSYMQAVEYLGPIVLAAKHSHMRKI